MTYRIRRSEGPKGTVLALSGELDSEQAVRLGDFLREIRRPSVLDLKEVTLVAREAVQLLARLEANGVRLVNCPEYVRSSMAAAKALRTES